MKQGADTKSGTQLKGKAKTTGAGEMKAEPKADMKADTKADKADSKSKADTRASRQGQAVHHRPVFGAEVGPGDEVQFGRQGAGGANQPRTRRPLRLQAHRHRAHRRRAAAPRLRQAQTGGAVNLTTEQKSTIRTRCCIQQRAEGVAEPDQLQHQRRHGGAAQREVRDGAGNPRPRSIRRGAATATSSSMTRSSSSSRARSRSSRC